MSNVVMIPEIQIDFDKMHDARMMEKYCRHEFGLATSLLEGDIVFLNVYNISESQLNSIRRRMAIEGAARGTVKVINKVRDAVCGAADFAAYRVAAPVAQAGIETVGKVGKVALKTAGTTVATCVSASLVNTREAYSDLKTDPHVVNAKQELGLAYGAVKNLFGFNSSNNSSIRIISNK